MERGIYTAEQWDRDEALAAFPGQEIDAEIYESLLDVVPPLSLPWVAMNIGQDVYNICAQWGFLMGEAASTTEAGPVYRAFGRRSTDGEKHYYYLGLFPAERDLNGMFYYFGPGKGMYNSILLPESALQDRKTAIRAAEESGAILYFYELTRGRYVDSKKLYAPKRQREGARK